MEKQEKKTDLFYCPKVDVMFQTYRKELLGCLGTLADLIKVSSAFEGNDHNSNLQSKIALMIMLNNQLTAVESFIEGYNKVDEVL